MKRVTKYVAACGALFVAAGVVVGLSVFGNPHAALISDHAAEPKSPQVDVIRNYRSWTQVNPQPVHISRQASAACARVLPMPPTDNSLNPHEGRLITVYVNDIGTPAMMTQLNPRFPVGSVIVKEKFSPNDKDVPELMTVMVKRERGFNPESGDWEYMVINGDGTKVQERGRLANCQACHIPRKEWDYVARDYLPNEVRSKLK